MSEQEIKDMREDLKYFSSSELKKDNPELYQDIIFRNYCKELLKASDKVLSSEETQPPNTTISNSNVRIDKRIFLFIVCKDTIIMRNFKQLLQKLAVNTP